MKPNNSVCRTQAKSDMARANETRVVAAALRVVRVERALEVASCVDLPLLTVAVGPVRLVVVCETMLLRDEEVADVDEGTATSVLEEVEDGMMEEEEEDEEEIEDEVEVGELLDEEDEVDCTALTPKPVAVPPS